MSKLNFAVYPAIALLSLAAAFSAHAGDMAEYDGYALPKPVTSNTTREAVRAAAIAARQNNEQAIFAEGYQAPVTLASNRSRADVRAEAIALRDETAAKGIEGYDPVYAVVTRAKGQQAKPVFAGTKAATGQ